MTAKQIGLLIKDERKKQGFTYRALQDKSGVCDMTISRVEKGNGTNYANILAICTALEIEITFNVKPQTVEI